MYKKNGYMETVAAAAECSMVKAVEEANEKSSSNEVYCVCIHKTSLFIDVYMHSFNSG